MFVTDKIIPYPSRSIEADVLEKDTWESDGFTPYNGMSDLVTEQLASRSAINNAYYERRCKDYIISYCHFEPLKMCPTLEGFTVNENGIAEREDYASSISKNEVVIRLEDIDPAWIRKYIHEAAIGYFLNKDGASSDMKKYKETNIVSSMNSEGEMQVVTESDLLLEEEEDFSLKEKLAAKQELPYLLKQLHRGSIMLRGSLISFIIRRAQLDAYVSISGMRGYKPADFYNCGTYWMQPDGKLGRVFKAADNKVDPFRTLFSWISESYGDNHELDKLYKYYERLKRVALVLGINLAQEDPSVYTEDFIRHATCVYLASNMEYLAEADGEADRRVLDVLTPDKLFAFGLNSSDISDVFGDAAETVPVRAESIFEKSVREYRDILKEDSMHPENRRGYLFRPNRRRVNAVLRIYKANGGEFKQQVAPGTNVIDISRTGALHAEDEIMLTEMNYYCILDLEKIIVQPIYENNFFMRRGILTASGLIIGSAVNHQVMYYDIFGDGEVEGNEQVRVKKQYLGYL